MSKKVIMVSFTIIRGLGQHRDRQGSCGLPYTSVALSSWGMSALNTDSTRAEESMHMFGGQLVCRMSELEDLWHRGISATRL
jgi:hypothetical protein